MDGSGVMPGMIGLISVEDMAFQNLRSDVSDMAKLNSLTDHWRITDEVGNVIYIGVFNRHLSWGTTVILVVALSCLRQANSQEQQLRMPRGLNAI